MSKLPASALCLLLVSVTGCQRSTQISERETEVLKTRLAGATPAELAAVADKNQQIWKQTRRFYELRQNEPAWIVADEPSAAVPALRALLSAAEDEGLNPQEYGIETIPPQEQSLKSTQLAVDAVELELSLTYKVLRYASHVALGHPIAAQIDQDWSVTPREVDIPGLVNEALAAGQLNDLPARLAPRHPEYGRLRQMLHRYRGIAAAGTLQPIPADLALTAGGSNPRLAALRNNLLVLGDLQEQSRGDANVFREDLAAADADFKARHAAQPDQAPADAQGRAMDTFDANLREAVRRFEARHGLDPDGIPDPSMIAAMNVPPQARVRQLALNLERWRWLPTDLGAPHVFVNIASYRLQVRDAQDAVALKMRVIVGKATNRTPVFSDTMTVVVFSPYWNIPQSIEAKEMWPSIIRDPGYLARKEIEVVRVIDGKTQVVDPASIDWEQAQNAGDIQLRQRPGEANALGFVKFLFPNRFNVYLHDTPTDNLFDKLTRDFSHGCVRLETPTQLAAYVLRDQPEWTTARIDAAMHAGTEQHVALKHPIPVHLVYLTAQVDEDGVPQFFEDVYGYDLRQEQLMKSAARLPMTVSANAR